MRIHLKLHVNFKLGNRFAVCKRALEGHLSAYAITWQEVVVNRKTTKMELSVLSLQAAGIALWAIDKFSGGALEKAGADILEFLTKRFQGKLQIRGTKQELLQAAILSEAEWDGKFKQDLERLVNKYYQARNTSVSQSTESGVNINVGNNPGTVIGQQIGQQFFR